MIYRTALLAGLALLTGGLEAPARADCATSGLRVRCLHVGPNTSVTESTAPRPGISARFVTVARPDTGQRNEAGHRVAAKQIAPRTDVLGPGDTLPGDVLILMNPLRYGLPRPEAGWTYFKMGRDIYRAEIRTRRVLNYVNPHINRR
ncbi:hypothetical protein [Pseudooceanicola onchidii]|uniref:hypothetical protein n=1 Tax=Pseudooceanicola onchidii TaxID=2562279 RepID=UPI0010AB24D6|nr:hypothetical protein [Pseudooceanicola onchidii]